MHFVKIKKVGHALDSAWFFKCNKVAFQDKHHVLVDEAFCVRISNAN